MATITMENSREFIKELKKVGIDAKRWRNSGEYAPPADVNYRGEMRVHTGGKPELIDTNDQFRQAVIMPTAGRYRNEYFLVGMDETSNFVSRLPKRAATVEEAHEILRPASAATSTIRQGEWFFQPTDVCTVCKEPLSMAGMDGVHDLSGDIHLGNQYGIGGTSHVAQFYTEHRGTAFVKGQIRDDRPGRHAPVELGDQWHQVIRNTERALDREPARVRPRIID